MNDKPAIPVALALGANIGDPLAQLRAAVDRLSKVVTDLIVSDVYVTEPIGIIGQPDFYNLVLTGNTSCTLYALHGASRDAERAIGRTPAARNGPRVIDIDILSYGQLVLSSDDLTVPHPRLHERSFVLAPLADIAPNWRHPLLDQTAAELLDDLRNPSAIARWGKLPDV